MESIENRVARLERACGRLKAGCVALVLVVVGSFVVAAGEKNVQDIVRAKKIEVVTDEGKTVASLEAGRFGGSLTINSIDGQSEVIAIADAGGPRITILDKSRQIIALAADRAGGQITISPNDASPVAQIQVDSKSRGVVILRDKDGKVLWNSDQAK